VSLRGTAPGFRWCLSLKFEGLDAYSRVARCHDMLSGMDNPEIVLRFLTDKAPAPYCDDCLATAAGIAPRQQVNIIARSFGLTSDFNRAKGHCVVCGGEKFVTSSARRAFAL
jgi:hypothetical protein